MYGKLLKKGVRCLEIDLWDGVDGWPVVTHGNTLCSKIRLVEIVKVIADNAFATGNPFPVILSLEDHCCLAQQVKAAAIFREAFGEKLLVDKVEAEDKNELPSPAQLCGKIILKHKKLATPTCAADNNSAFTLREKVRRERLLSSTTCRILQEHSYPILRLREKEKFICWSLFAVVERCFSTPAST